MRRALILVSFLVTSFHEMAHADALPMPGRPEFDDTPVPMPSEPELFSLALVVLLVGLFYAVARARRQGSC